MITRVRVRRVAVCDPLPARPPCPHGRAGDAALGAKSVEFWPASCGNLCLESMPVEKTAGQRLVRKSLPATNGSNSTKSRPNGQTPESGAERRSARRATSLKGEPHLVRPRRRRLRSSRDSVCRRSAVAGIVRPILDHGPSQLPGKAKQVGSVFSFRPAFSSGRVDRI